MPMTKFFTSAYKGKFSNTVLFFLGNPEKSEQVYSDRSGGNFDTE